MFFIKIKFKKNSFQILIKIFVREGKKKTLELRVRNFLTPPLPSAQNRICVDTEEKIYIFRYIVYIKRFSMV